MFAGFGSFPFSSHFDDFSDFDAFQQRRPRRATTYKYYEALGVPHDASPAQIRKAFQQLAMRLHPDKGGDPEKFKEVKEAYEVLKDENKRRRYDQVGDQGLQEGLESEGHGTVDDLFDELLGMCGNRAARRGRANSRSFPQKGKDQSHTICVTLEEIYNGATRHVRLARKRTCVGCKGTGFKNAVRHVCQQCQGQGIRVIVRQYQAGIIQEIRNTCDACGGSGLDSNPMNYCQLCCGAGEMEENKTLDVYIEQGMHENHRITYPGEASCTNPHIQPGDVIVVVKTQAHATFKRKNTDLLVTHRIGLVDSLCGVDFSLQHLDGRQLRIQSSPGEIIRPGQVKCIEGEGMPVHGQPSVKGNLYVQFDVEYPDKIPPQRQAKLRSILERGSTSRPEASGDPVIIRDVHNLDEELETRVRFGRQNGAAYDSDDSDDMQGSRHRVQCAQQ